MPAEFPRKKTVKPIMIGEYGAIEPVGEMIDHYLEISPHNTKSQWLRDSHDAVNGSKPRTAECHWCGIYSDIAAIVYFDIEGLNGHWEITSSAGVERRPTGKPGRTPGSTRSTPSAGRRRRTAPTPRRPRPTRTRPTRPDPNNPNPDPHVNPTGPS